ncbi:hypothetical protein JCM10212_004426 [Sporobolomyces blumeae]
MFKLSAVALVALVASLAQAQQISTPTALFTCEPYQINWTGGTGPYYVRANQGGTTSQVLETLVSNENVNSYTWNVDLAAGTSVTLALTDSTGASAYSDKVTVQAGSSTSCIGNAAAASGSSGASSAASSATDAASSSTSAAGSVTSSAASKTSSAASKGASASQSAASAGASSAGGTSGASTLAVSGVLGVAAVGAAIFA